MSQSRIESGPRKANLLSLRARPWPGRDGHGRSVTPHKGNARLTPPAAPSIIAVRSMTTSLPPERLKDIYRTMLLNRLLEERLANLYRQGKVVGGLYRSLGQEATSVATAFADRATAGPAHPNLGSVSPAESAGRLTQYGARHVALAAGREPLLGPGRASTRRSRCSGRSAVGGHALAERRKRVVSADLPQRRQDVTARSTRHQRGRAEAAIVLVIEFADGRTRRLRSKRGGSARGQTIGYSIREVVDGNDAIAVTKSRRHRPRPRAGAAHTRRVRDVSHEGTPNTTPSRGRERGVASEGPARPPRERSESGATPGRPARRTRRSRWTEDITPSLRLPDPSRVPAAPDDAITVRARAGVFTGGL